MARSYEVLDGIDGTLPEARGNTPEHRATSPAPGTHTIQHPVSRISDFASQMLKTFAWFSISGKKVKEEKGSESALAEVVKSGVEEAETGLKIDCIYSRRHLEAALKRIRHYSPDALVLYFYRAGSLGSPIAELCLSSTVDTKSLFQLASFNMFLEAMDWEEREALKAIVSLLCGGSPAMRELQKQPVQVIISLLEATLENLP